MRYTKDGALILINKFKFTKSSLNLLEHLLASQLSVHKVFLDFTMLEGINSSISIVNRPKLFTLGVNLQS